MAEVVDIKAARARRDIEDCDLRCRLSIEWRGGAYEMAYEDFENDPPNECWLWSELAAIVEQRRAPCDCSRCGGA